MLIAELLARDELVATLTPTEVCVRRKGRRQVHKSDLIDAELCARIGREEQATLWRLVAVPEAVAVIRVWARYQEGLIRDRTRAVDAVRTHDVDQLSCRGARPATSKGGEVLRSIAPS